MKNQVAYITDLEEMYRAHAHAGVTGGGMGATEGQADFRLSVEPNTRLDPRTLRS